MKTDEFSVSGDDVIRVIKKIIAEGNARKISIKKEDGTTLVEFPVTIGAIGALLAPTFAAVGAIAALVSKCTIVVERNEKGDTAA